jgi:hypothetical protein
MFSLLCLMLLCVLFYQPLLSDLRVANLGSLQFFYLTVVVSLASALPRVSSFGPRAGLGALLLAALAVLTLCKPNVALICALLAAHLLVRYGRRFFVTAALPAIGVTAVALIGPSLYFRSWTVWREWYDFVYGSNAYMLVRPVAHGNYSTAVLVSSWIGADVYAVAVTLAILLAASLLVIGGREGWSGWRPGPFSRGALTGLFREPHVPLAVGILVTMATAPIYWLHYYVLSLIPSLWLLSASAASRYPAALAAAAVLMSSGAFGLLLWWFGWPGALPPSIALSWLPLWCALLIGLRTLALDAPRQPGSAGESPSTTGRGARASVTRRRRR